MNKRYFSFGIIVIAIAGILTAAISYTTDLRSARAIEQSTIVNTPIPAGTTTPTVTEAPTGKEKSCGCCTERKTRLEKKIQEARERRQAEQEAQNVVTLQ